MDLWGDPEETSSGSDPEISRGTPDDTSNDSSSGSSLLNYYNAALRGVTTGTATYNTITGKPAAAKPKPTTAPSSPLQKYLLPGVAVLVLLVVVGFIVKK
jgi:hypothetical protein